MYRDPIITLKDEERTPFNVGWLAGHYGRPGTPEQARFMGMDGEREIQEWTRGYETAQRTHVLFRVDRLSEITEVT